MHANQNTFVVQLIFTFCLFFLINMKKKEKLVLGDAHRLDINMQFTATEGNGDL